MQNIKGDRLLKEDGRLREARLQESIEISYFSYRRLILLFNRYVSDK